ncbi:MAG: ATP-binding protein [Methanoregula sp.]|nr:ATP-binding protein [Methanoregula sp.]
MPKPFNPLFKKISINKGTVFIILLILGLSIITFLAVYQATQNIVIDNTKTQLTSFASMTATEIDGDTFASLQPGDEDSSGFIGIRDQLVRYRSTNPDIRSLYTLRNVNGTTEYVVNADYGNPAADPPSGKIGVPYPDTTNAMMQGYFHPSANEDFITDKWGTFLSAYAPIRDSTGNVVGIVGVDTRSETLYDKLNYLKTSYLLILVMIFVVASTGGIIATMYWERAEVTLKESEEYLATILRSLQTGVVVIEAETHTIIDVNDAALLLIGASREEVVGRRCHDFICIYEEGRCPITDHGQVADNSERTLKTSEGRIIPILKSVSPISIGGKLHLVEAFVDISERKDMENRMAGLINDLERVNTELKDFAYIVSHDLKAPLRAIGSLSQWLYTDYKDKFDDDGKAQLDLLMSRVNRMQTLIEGVLEYSRVGRINEGKVPVNTGLLVREVIENLSPPETITITVDDSLPVINFERTRISQIFSNLISNAVKYMDKPEGEIHISSTREGNFWKFGVADNGPGIDAKYHEKVFQIFQTLHPRDQKESTGIGLTIVKKIIDMYGGRIWIESKPGEGSIFYFTLPISVEEESGKK